MVALFLAFLMLAATMSKRDVLLPAFAGILPGARRRGGPSTRVVIDTSAVIDGRIVDIARTGFILGNLVVPRFVLDELQRIADSPDAIRRNRGRRGLEMLSALQKDAVTPVEISEATYPEVAEVDAKLMAYARDHGAAILTNDYNLNRVADLQGIRVLNVNELANAVKAVVHPGEEMSVRIIQEGKEAGQGVGYLDDGTMIVVEGGAALPQRGGADHGHARPPDGGRPDDLRPAPRASPGDRRADAGPRAVHRHPGCRRPQQPDGERQAVGRPVGPARLALEPGRPARHARASRGSPSSVARRCDRPIPRRRCRRTPRTDAWSWPAARGAPIR